MKKRVIPNDVIIVMVVMVVIATVAVVRMRQKPKGDVNPYKYDIEQYKKVDMALIGYCEVAEIKIDAELYGLAVDDDQIYVTGDKLLLLFDKNGAETKRIELDGAAKCVTVDADKKIYLGMADHVEVYSADGNCIDRWKTINKKSIITSIAVSESSLFVADAGTRQVYRFDKDGSLRSSFGEKDEQAGVPGFVIPSPYFDLLIDRTDQSLWVVNPGHRQIENYDEDGRFKKAWGASSIKLLGFSGCCNPSHLAMMPDGSFVTSEKGLVRVKVYNHDGEFVNVVVPPNSFDEHTVGVDLAVDSTGRIFVLDSSRSVVRVFEKK
ncbi:MAG: hypothetical protein KAI74_06170 [Kiritimatiellae bacterium]|nr:hypothetical protein [Kiritimatiellia bacterium]